MKKELTELIYILDRSGSMSGLEPDTIGGYNAFLEKQKSMEGEAIITTVLFDDRYELLHDRVRLKDARPISGQEYFVRGTTALLDAIGHSVERIKTAQKAAKKAARAKKVLFIITTDGMENASRTYDYDKIKTMVEKQKEKHGWEFVFIGANIDAIKTAAQFGVAANRAVEYRADKAGTRLMYETISNVTCGMHSAAPKAPPIMDGWKEEIEADNKRA